MANKKRVSSPTEAVSESLSPDSILYPINDEFLNARCGGMSRPTFYKEMEAGRAKTVMVGSRRFMTGRQLAEFIGLLESKVAPLPSERPNNRWRPADKKSGKAQHAPRR